ncbi:BLUF domain-containing protein [Flammeovirga kamogawensis]|uniref:BLUF domain-containing protein n=1 Tax=Flammeovirga kamogawensis TaxID=373891 RepID=A0ABX8GUU1_9BACT|nr:BLUF domain-containing protein [Flammeovirga kamogawensis]MBB6459773.1 hypothetical protein [Flammeovirga kamogawensis]QWG07169.1 BLUF domain-containing protein [Flammeovirga kamogawensis]TRX68991.1 BLUF domain-containing protein [Flammeovirga kamogawensis]
MYCLCYTSKKTASFDINELKEILIKSRINNEKKDITGILLLIDDLFIQILEGEKKDLEQLYDVIKVDDRHDYIQKIFSGEIESRNFLTWSMGFQQVTWEDLEELGMERQHDKSLSLSEYFRHKSHYLIEVIKEFNKSSELKLNLPK